MIETELKNIFIVLENEAASEVFSSFINTIHLPIGWIFYFAHAQVNMHLSCHPLSLLSIRLVKVAIVFFNRFFHSVLF